MGRFGLLLISAGSSPDYHKPSSFRFDGRFHRRGIQSTMGKNQKAFAFSDGNRRKKIPDVSLLPLKPQQLRRAARPDHVEPHQPGIHQGIKTHIAAITGEDIEYRNYRVTASK